MKNLTIVFLAVLVVVLAGALLSKGTLLGSNQGEDRYFPANFHSGFISSGYTNILQSASSTLWVGAASSAGCLVLGDSANAASPVYITASGATVSATTTKPAACRATGSQ